MATVNYEILRPDLPAAVGGSVMSGISSAQQVGAQQLQNQLGQLQLAKAGQEIAEENKLRELMASGVNLDSPEVIRKMYEISPKQGMAFEKSRAELTKNRADAQLKQFEMDQQRYSNLSFNPSNENVVANLQDMVLERRLSPEQAAQMQQKILTMPPEERSKFFLAMGADAKTRYTHGTVSAGTLASNAVTMRGQNMVDARAREQLEETRRGRELQYGRDVVANTITDNQGNVTQFNRYGEVIGTPGKIGKPSATFEKTQALQQQQQKDLTLAIGELEKATKDGGLIDQSTGSGLGRATDVAASFIGKATPGAIAIAKLKPIADLTLKMVPRFEGPQSDKDTQSYKEAAGQLADASLPTDIRKAAGREVLRLMKARKGQFVSENMANEGIGAGGVDTSNPLLK